MAIYDLSIQQSRAQAEERFSQLLASGEVVELKRKDQSRSLRQNDYLHLCIAYVGTELGLAKDYVKQNYYKIAANKEIYVKESYDTIIHQWVVTLRSSADLTKEEMNISIDRFGRWCAEEAGIILPDPADRIQMQMARQEVEQAKRYL